MARYLERKLVNGKWVYKYKESKVRNPPPDEKSKKHPSTSSNKPKEARNVKEQVKSFIEDKPDTYKGGYSSEELKEKQEEFNDDGLHNETGDYFDEDGFNILGFNKKGFDKNGKHYKTGRKIDDKGYDEEGVKIDTDASADEKRDYLQEKYEKEDESKKFELYDDTKDEIYIYEE